MKNVTTKTYLQVGYHDVEEAINEAYPEVSEEYNLPCMEEVGNDVYMVFDVNGFLDDYDIKRINEARSNGRWNNWLTRSLLNDMANRGLVDKGEYLVCISW